MFKSANSNPLKAHTMAGIIERLEAASGADRELDELIWEAVSGLSARQDRPAYGGGKPISKRIQGLPKYTSSIDAALSLVPEGYWWEIRQTCGLSSPLRNFGGRNGIFDARMAKDFGAPGHLGSHNIPAITLVISALRARAHAAFDERIGQKPGEHTPSILVRSQRRELAETAAKAILSRTPSQPAPVVALNGYVLLPEKLTAEIACALEMAAPPPATSQEAADQLVADYSTVWSHVIALGTPASPQPDRESEGEDIDTLDAMEAHEHWGVSVDTHGDDIVRIETAMLAGKADLSEQDLATIRTAARHLLSFAGAPRIASSTRPQATEGEK